MCSSFYIIMLMCLLDGDYKLPHGTTAWLSRTKSLTVVRFLGLFHAYIRVFFRSNRAVKVIFRNGHTVWRQSKIPRYISWLLIRWTNIVITNHAIIIVCINKHKPSKRVDDRYNNIHSKPKRFRNILILFMKCFKCRFEKDYGDK
jgi:hypothetical protein